MVGGGRPYFAPRVALVFFAISFGIFSVACRKEEKQAPPPAPPKDFRAGLPQGGSLEGQLAAEAAARSNDPDTIRIENVLGTLADAGVGFGAPRQVLGRNELALYCATSNGPDGELLTVCEYPSAEAAVNGERETSVLTSRVAGHISRVRKKSVLHLIKKSTTPDAAVQKIFAAFEGA